MKKVFSLITFIVISIACFSQAYVSPTGSFSSPNYVYLGGTTSDTLYASDTLIWSIRIKGDDVKKMALRYEITKVTGTVSDSVWFWGSFDGTTKDAAIDTIFNSNVSTGYKYPDLSQWENFAYPYLIVWSWDKAGVRTSVKSVRKLRIYSQNQ